jgi:HK97 family phage major capsid protein
MNIAEQVTAFEAKRTTIYSRMTEIMSKAADGGSTLDAAEQEEYDGLEQDVAAVDSHLKRLKTLESVNAAGAKPIEGVKTVESGAAARGGDRITVKAQPKLAPGVGFARIAKVKGLARLDGESPREIAKNLYGEDSDTFAHFTKAAVPAANSGNAGWAGNLITDGGAFADFVEFLRPQTIIGKFGMGNIPALRRIPFDTPVLIQSTGGTGYWVGEGKAKPLTSWTTSRTTMTPLKVATIAAVTEEMLRRSSVDADIWIRDELARAVASRIDLTFIDPTAAAVAGVSPASITNGVTARISSGNDADAIRADVLGLSAAFRAVNNSTSGAVWIMSEGVAEAVSTMMNPLGQPEFPGLTPEGGTFLGKPVITSEYVPSAYDPDGAGANVAGAIVVLAKAQDIFYGDEGGVTVDFSREASLEMADNPTGSSVTPTASSMVSMFQTNSVAFRAERALNWMKRRPEAVAVLASVNWGE